MLKTLLLLGASNGTAADPRVRALLQHPNASAIVRRCSWEYTGTNLVWSATVHVMDAAAPVLTLSLRLSNARGAPPP